MLSAVVSAVVSEKVVLVWMVFFGGYGVGRSGGRGVVLVVEIMLSIM